MYNVFQKSHHNNNKIIKIIIKKTKYSVEENKDV